LPCAFLEKHFHLKLAVTEFSASKNHAQVRYCSPHIIVSNGNIFPPFRINLLGVEKKIAIQATRTFRHFVDAVEQAVRDKLPHLVPFPFQWPAATRDLMYIPAVETMNCVRRIFSRPDRSAGCDKRTYVEVANANMFHFRELL